MPPEPRFVPRFAAEPPQEELPYGRWATRLAEEFLSAAPQRTENGDELGTPEQIVWYPDRTWHGRTYVPATAATGEGYELFGYVRFVPAAEGGDASDFFAYVDFTEETAERNPDWQLDLCDEVIGAWRGEGGAVASMTLVWGHPLVSGGRVATAELAELAVDQCALISERFTLIAPDDYRHDLLEIKLFGSNGQQIARESLYDEDGEEDADQHSETDRDGEADGNGEGDGEERAG